jgi:sporulation related protein
VQTKGGKMSEQALHGQYAPEEHYSEPGLVANFTSWIGALTSLGLVAGLGVWGYQLTLRDVTDVPVIRAMTGAPRVLPDDPGGETAAHQGLAVNKVQTGDGTETAADRVVLAPDPVRLSNEDIAKIKLKPVSREQKLASMPQNMTDVSALTNSTADEIDALVLQAVTQSSRDARVGSLANLPGVKRSPRPKARAVVASITTPPELVAVASQNVDVDPSEILTGTRLVQLGAFDDVDTAKREWRNIIERHGDLVGVRKRFIQEAESGGRKFYRLRMVGFENLSDSRRLCSALLARGTPCIPVTAR